MALDPLTPAERARTAIAASRSGRLLTYPRGACVPPHDTPVAVDGAEAGPVLYLAPGSLAAAQLRARPLATLRACPPGWDPVTVHGGMVPLPPAGDGRVRYRMQVAAVRLGARARCPVPVEEYLRVRPDPLCAEAPAVLAHLVECHTDALAACLRARGHDVSWAEPRALDSRGIDVVGVGPDGAIVVRLAFPRPVSRLQDLPAGLAGPLLCRCRRR